MDPHKIPFVPAKAGSAFAEHDVRCWVRGKRTKGQSRWMSDTYEATF
jgi:hypothetical protein